jgi:hypothetical protein
MSQAGVLTAATSGAPIVETLTGNSGGAVGPNAAFNIDILGNNTSGINVVGTPASNTLTIVGIQATTTQRGTSELATNAEAIAGVDTSNAVTSAALAAKLGSQTLHGLPIGAGTAAALTWTAAPTDGQILIGSTGNDPVLATLTAGGGITIANGAGTITITSAGADILAYTQVTNGMSPYTVLSTDEYLAANTSGGAVTLRFPNAPTTGRVYYIKDRNGTAATSNISVTTVGGAVTIDGSTTYTINTNYASINILFNGTSYEVF